MAKRSWSESNGGGGGGGSTATTALDATVNATATVEPAPNGGPAVCSMA